MKRKESGRKEGEKRKKRKEEEGEKGRERGRRWGEKEERRVQMCSVPPKSQEKENQKISMLAGPAMSLDVLELRHFFP